MSVTVASEFTVLPATRAVASGTQKATKGWLRSTIDWLFGHKAAPAFAVVAPRANAVAEPAKDAPAVRTAVALAAVPTATVLVMKPAVVAATAPKAEPAKPRQIRCRTRKGGWRAELPFRMRAVAGRNVPKSRRHKPAAAAKSAHKHVVWMESRPRIGKGPAPRAAKSNVIVLANARNSRRQPAKAVKKAA